MNVHHKSFNTTGHSITRRQWDGLWKSRCVIALSIAIYLLVDVNQVCVIKEQPTDAEQSPTSQPRYSESKICNLATNLDQPPAHGFRPVCSILATETEAASSPPAKPPAFYVVQAFLAVATDLAKRYSIISEANEISDRYATQTTEFYRKCNIFAVFAGPRPTLETSKSRSSSFSPLLPALGANNQPSCTQRATPPYLKPLASSAAANSLLSSSPNTLCVESTSLVSASELPRVTEPASVASVRFVRRKVEPICRRK